jgi:uncharacterized protein YqgC (DUF456 family)
VDLWLVLALLLMAIGLVGTVVPALPGIALVLAGAVLYAAATGFTVVGVGDVLLFAALTALALGLDLLAHMLGARAFGATCWGVVGAVLGVVVGLLVGGPLGLLVGPLLGAVALEALSGQPLRRALRSGVGAVVGYLLGTAAQAALAIVIIVRFVRLAWG